MSSSLEQLFNTVNGIFADSPDPESDILQVMIVERWDNLYGRQAVVYMSFHDIEHFNRWLDIEGFDKGFSRPRLKVAIADIKETFPGMQMSDILNGLYKYY